MKFHKKGIAALSIRLALPLTLGISISASAAGNEQPGSDEPAADTDDFTSEVLVSGLNNPFEIIYGPDGWLWVTERDTGEVTKVNPADGSTKTILTIPDVVATPGEQDGLLGMALHPGLLSGKANGHDNNSVYLSYTYDGDPGEALDRRQRIVRYTYDEATETLVEPTELISGLMASDDHNSGRLLYGPDDKLYYTIGDRGNNQDSNACRPNLAQLLPTAEQIAAGDWTAYQGKSLRLNPDGSIPDDNPELNGVVSHIYTYGHRNAQGIVFASNDLLYSSEQGPKSDDELNLLSAGGNYGWPFVAGYKDNSGYVFGDWSAVPGCGTTVPYDAFVIPDVVPQYIESDFNDPAFVQPLRTYYTVPSTHDFSGEACEPSGLFFICYPTIAPSSLDFYALDAIPGWQNSFLMPTLKDGQVYRVELAADGQSVGDSEPLWRTVNRYRDTAIHPDGTTVYVATDIGGLARGTDGDATDQLENPGSILVFHYDGTVGD
ncbi:glucose/sorbosone family PQQ-dependent dehydrogenase [Diaminobutyricimonas sp. TR449]|uniref:glucose/sorbosone family PQQ-dependent dehydrogenase n=1 Tax=Diaminobutyricimonas sp. TR449 TaxID=2708076 RepID=UPI00141E5C99|nr:glucose/sorbosone family PQQ-dependent dehydrogenase [Diaminobutyricimonas sp. TR449]